MNYMLGKFKDLSPEEFQKEISEPGEKVILDVRTADEYHSGHIPESLNLNFMNPMFKEELKKLNPMISYYVYCRSGGRSHSACKVMVDQGFKNVHNLLGGLMDYAGVIK